MARAKQKVKNHNPMPSRKSRRRQGKNPSPPPTTTAEPSSLHVPSKPIPPDVVSVAPASAVSPPATTVVTYIEGHAVVTQDLQFDVGSVAHQAIINSTARLNSRLIFPGLLTKLIKAAGVAVNDNDVIYSSPSVLDYGTITRINKPLPDELIDDATGPRVTRRRTQKRRSPVTSTARTSAAPTTAVPPTYEIPPIPPSATVYGSEQWLLILAQQKEETNQQLSAILDTVTLMHNRLLNLEAKSERFWMYVRDHFWVQNKSLRRTDPLLAGELPRFPSGIVPPQVRLPTVAARSAPPIMTTVTTVSIPAENVQTPASVSDPANIASTSAIPNPTERGNAH